MKTWLISLVIVIPVVLLVWLRSQPAAEQKQVPVPAAAPNTVSDSKSTKSPERSEAERRIRESRANVLRLQKENEASFKESNELWRTKVRAVVIDHYDKNKAPKLRAYLNAQNLETSVVDLSLQLLREHFIRRGDLSNTRVRDDPEGRSIHLKKLETEDKVTDMELSLLLTPKQIEEVKALSKPKGSGN